MKIIKALIILLVISFASCDVDYYENPNDPTTPPSNSVFNDAVKRIMDDSRALFFGGGRFTQVTMQYWHQSEYGDEDRYGYRESMREYWEDFYYNLENLRQVIVLNEDPATKDAASAYGHNDAQIACARIMMAYTFNIMADVWGPIPYWSYGTDDPQFQALQITGEDEILSPAYAPQEKIYKDILNELQGAYEQLNNLPDNATAFTSGDNIYDGDVDKWMKFANSLRLRIALKVREADQGFGQQHIDDVVNSGVHFTSNADNAIFQYESSDKNSAPYYYGWYVGNRSDFAVGNAFIQLLKGETVPDHSGNALTTNPFSEDPRLPIFAQDNNQTSYPYGSRNPEEGHYVGMPIAENSAEAATFVWESLPGTAIIERPDYPMVLMEYAEVEFILSELDGWAQDHYENGVEASMQRWGVDQADIDSYIGSMPGAGEATVLAQKYIASYMQATNAWTEYRRTNFPDILVQPGDDYSIYVPSADTTFNYTFNPLSDVTDLPYRMRYPQQEQTLNADNYQEALGWLENGDTQNTRLWWDVD
jgi:hypothetical protein